MSYLKIPDDIRQIMKIGRTEFPDLFWAIDPDSYKSMDDVRKEMTEQLETARVMRDNKK